MGKVKLISVDGVELSSDYMYGEKSKLYLKFDFGADVGYSNYTSAANLLPMTPWSLGVAMMGMELVDAGLYSKRLAEQMYLASRVFEHNLAVRARQRGMRITKNDWT